MWNGVETVGEMNDSRLVRPLKQVRAQGKGAHEQEKSQQTY